LWINTGLAILEPVITPVVEIDPVFAAFLIKLPIILPVVAVIFPVDAVIPPVDVIEVKFVVGVY
jgi:hypothetical protein